MNKMKLKPEKREIDLYVSNKRLTEKEYKELSDFIKAYKEKKKLKKGRKKVN
jgi:hypothetical protein